MAEEQPPNRIRELRDARGWSVRELADRIRKIPGAPKVDFATLNRMERGLQPLDLPRMKRIARGLECKVSELLVDDDVELRASEDMRAVLAGFEVMPRKELPALLTAAREIVRVSHGLAAQAAGLRGSYETVTAFAEMWNNRFDDDDRERSVEILQAVKGRTGRG